MAIKISFGVFIFMLDYIHRIFNYWKKNNDKYCWKVRQDNYMGKAKRKPLPQPPHHWWLTTDGCWFCKNKNNCNSCKALKEQSVSDRRRRIKRENNLIRNKMDY